MDFPLDMSHSSYTFVTLTMKALYSGVMVLASPTVGVSRLAVSPQSLGKSQP